MNNIKAIIEEINLQNGSNYKIDILKKHSENELFKRVLKMTYDNVIFTYGITMKNVSYNKNEGTPSLTLSEALDKLERDFVTRKITGNEAIIYLAQILESLSSDDSYIFEKIVDRDLKINLGTSNINKVFKELIVKPVYMRCGVFTKDSIDKKTGKTQKGTINDVNIKGAYIQLKADGTYREVTVDNGKVYFISRSGETYEYPVLEERFSNLPSGKYIGEMTISGTNNRSESNGILNSDNIPQDRIKFELWDYVTLEEYTSAANKVKNTTPYLKRFEKLSEILKDFNNPQIETIESYVVNSISEALSYVSKWMNDGLEGGILKDKDGVFRDGTSKHQLKLKLEIDADLRITGFTEGTKGTSREKTFGAITFANDEGTIKGQTSGFTDKELEDFNKRREELIGKIITIQFNDLTKGRDNDYYALSHPRFIEIRTDKTETDTLSRVLEMKQMAMSL